MLRRASSMVVSRGIPTSSASLAQFCDRLTSAVSPHSNDPPSMWRSLSTAEVPEAAKVGRLNHIAIAVPDLKQSADFYKTTLGAKVSDPQALPEHGVTVIFVELENTKLELLQPLGENSPVQKFLEKNPAGGLHHVCLEVQDVKAGIEHVKKTVRTLADDPKIGAHDKPVVFLHPKDCNGVLLELEEAGSITS